MKSTTVRHSAISSLKDKCTCAIGIQPCQIHGWKPESKSTHSSPETVAAVESYIRCYVSFAEPAYVFPLALWTIGTYCFQEFDAYPYLVITSATKRSGKSMLAEQLAFCCSNPRQFAAMTASTLFRSIAEESPTIFFDEAETLASDAASTMRAVLNVGYRKGQTIPRVGGRGITEFPTYCPKVFVLIGDVYDTLRDRSIVITMRRAEAPRRRLYKVAKEEGEDVRIQIASALESRTALIAEAFAKHPELDFLTGRDAEIWTPLFAIASVFCPSRLEELTAAAVDIATEKTVDAKRYTVLESSVDVDDEYAQRLLMDLYTILLTAGRAIASKDAIASLHALPASPWRKFRGPGLQIRDLARLLNRFGVKPVRLAQGKGFGNQTFLRGYKLSDVSAAVSKNGGAR